MANGQWQFRIVALRLAAMAVVSVLILGLMFKLYADPSDADRVRVADVLRGMGWTAVWTYFGFAIIHTLCRAMRYQLLLGAAPGVTVPPMKGLYLVTMVRNMLVDLLPARLGELGFVGLLRYVHAVPAGTGLSSLAASIVFDIFGLCILVTGLVGLQVIMGDVQQQLLFVLAGLVLLCLVAWIVLFYGMTIVLPVLAAIRRTLKDKLGSRWVHEFMVTIAAGLDAIRKGGIALKLLGWSVLLRICKYSGYFFCFRQVTGDVLPTLAAAEPWKVVTANIVSEAATGLPIPAVAGFGVYEAAGTGVWKLFGFPEDEALLATLSLHIVSQGVDYILGGLGLLIIWWSELKRRAVAAFAPVQRPGVRTWAAIVLVLVLACGFAAVEWRRVTKKGAIRPPEVGVAVGAAALQEVDSIRGLKGGIVWSSNRGGNHDLYEMSLPSGEVRQLTTDSHTDTFPAYSPDGRHIAFSRSQVPWVSQRNMEAWDIWILDRNTGGERLVAQSGREPRWVDADSLVFARDAKAIIEVNLVTGTERLMLQTGTGDLTGKLSLHTPSWNREAGMIAATIGGNGWKTALIDLEGRVTTVAGGCQIAWQPGSRDLVWMEPRGGELKNAIYVRESGQDRRLLDLPLPFSHEYFPKFSQDRAWMVLGACDEKGHEHDTSDYEIFLWKVGSPAETAIRLTFHTGNDCWPDISLAL